MVSWERNEKLSGPECAFKQQRMSPLQQKALGLGVLAHHGPQLSPADTGPESTARVGRDGVIPGIQAPLTAHGFPAPACCPLSNLLK